MSEIKSLVNNWALPDRSTERAQVTLRISYNDYARLHALKDVFTTRNVNDMISDLVRVGLDEVIDSLPVYTRTQEDYEQDLRYGEDPLDILPIGALYGPKIEFQHAYRRILNQKSEEDGKQDLKSEQKQLLKAVELQGDAA